MGKFGFSYVGLVFLLSLMIPNFIWIKHQPSGYNDHNENKILVILERVGQVLVTCTVLVFNFNISRWSVWNFWLIAAVVLMILYEWWWVRYFKSQRRLEDFYVSFCHIPVAGATLPVLAFLLLGIYGKVIWLILSSILLGIGHIGIHLQHRKELK